MPIQIPSISRRRFLGTTLATGAGLVLGAGRFSALAEETDRSPDCWALLSDTHIPADRDRVLNGVCPVKNLIEIRKDILTCPKKPKGAIISGDCVFLQGLAEDYPTLLEEVQPLRDGGMSLHFVLGNHDHRSHFLNALAVHEKRADRPHIPDNYCSVLETPKVNWFFLDALQRTNDTPGLIGKSQLNWLARELDLRSNKPALLVAHHNLRFGLPSEKQWEGHLKDSDDLWELILPRKQVKGYVYGHSHQWKCEAKDGVHLINIPATAWKFQAEEPTAWVLAELKADGIALTPRCLDPVHSAHDKTVNLVWRK